jgi:hypothetical protein
MLWIVFAAIALVLAACQPAQGQAAVTPASAPPAGSPTAPEATEPPTGGGLLLRVTNTGPTAIADLVGTCPAERFDG